MSLVFKSLLKLLRGVRTRRLALVAAISTFLVPSFAFAAGGGSVSLHFTKSDFTYLYISLGFGVVALFVGWLISRYVMRQSSGDEKMQEVGAAIKSGALAYLRQQVTMMSVFVLLLAIGLFFMFSSRYDEMLALWISLSFIGGVAASYFAGYIGMIMAVNANTRTAHAAISSFKNALEIAFKAGAVAGLVTVGMGLIGATLIFMIAKGDAMKLLIGFGFGGSLAALFMRVGGGIFTKAADVGADLVGKVEAGIPEDDARNPATIADNVGDNVGDCAGMAADIFESYEVTLVAALVLGAATATMFDQETWMRLILFALMARGVGIIASIVGIFMVKGSDDIDVDPLRLIRRGFNSSALIAIAATLGLAYFMMGGPKSQSELVVSNELISSETQLVEDFAAIHEILDELSEDEDVPKYTISVDKILESERFNAMFPEDGALGPRRRDFVSVAIFTEEVDVQPAKNLQHFKPINFSDEDNPVLSYTVFKAAEGFGEEPTIITFGEAYEDNDLFVYEVEITTADFQIPAAGGQPPATTSTQRSYYGPMSEDQFSAIKEQAASFQQQFETVNKFDVTLYSNSEGDVRAAISKGEEHLASYLLESSPGSPNPANPGINFYKSDVKTVKTAYDALLLDPAQRMPQEFRAKIATIEQHTAAWWQFALCIIFGILMAFVFEKLTDYYVSLRGKPVQEVAGVSTAGPAPMIITGFALGKESSVFSLLAIVVSLIMPLLVFNPAEYGGYLLSFYGIALVGLGLLTTTGFILAMDTFGPISDNAQGIFEMSGANKTHPEAAKAIQRLDAAGNTTKALTKGFAIATAVVAAVALFHAYVEEGGLTVVGMPLQVPEIFLGVLIGGAAPYLFSAFAINAVGRASFELINDVRAQFRNDPGILAGTSKPDYAKCVAIVTKAAQKELIGPAVLAIAFPVLVGFGFSIGKEGNLVGAQALGGFLVGAIVSGQLLAVMLANSGGIWDNAKKLIEDGMYGGKGSKAHEAGIVCDTVGDPFKDTAGPALNPLIKVMNLVALLMVPIVIMPRSDAVLITITVIAALALAGAVYWSKRGSMFELLQAGQAEAEAAGKGTSE
ncbi:MAG: sodium/proton-translocating pyrophosphatase [Armatimonadetes bacterium]|nr:sodium/proton-translocating pyrophosphatase [Armatimonadota bacterium]